MERDELMRQIEQARAEEAQHSDFPETDILLSYLTLVEQATDKQTIMNLSGDFDSLIKLGWGWQIRRLGESSRPLIEEVYKLVMAKRASVCPAYPELAEMVEAAVIRYRQMGKNEMSDEDVPETRLDYRLPSPFREAVSNLKSVARLLREPYLVGLYEETEFGSLSKEIRCHFTFIKKTMRRQAFPLSGIERLEAKVRDGLKRRSAAYTVQNPAPEEG
ncbi:MAG: hypothetical protein KJ077_10985 [Anaerolineae bacterium]|nr:hypothetical protein [Anaerolineae bacterium]